MDRGNIARALRGFNAVGVLVFGLVVLFAPTPDAGYYRSIGMASIGMGLFALVMTFGPLRRGDRWTWWALWFFPLFWTAHLVLALPPGKDHIHQVAFIAMSVAGLLLLLPDVFPHSRSA